MIITLHPTSCILGCVAFLGFAEAIRFVAFERGRLAGMAEAERRHRQAHSPCELRALKDYDAAVKECSCK